MTRRLAALLVCLAFAAPALAVDQLLFVSERDGNPEVYLANADGSGVRRLTRNPAEDTRPAWSPDGRRIAFVSDRDGSRQAYIMPADGGIPRQVTWNISRLPWCSDRVANTSASDHRTLWTPRPMPRRPSASSIQARTCHSSLIDRPLNPSGLNSGSRS